MSLRRAALVVVLTLAAPLTLTACSAPTSRPDSAGPAPAFSGDRSPAKPSGELTIFAAASLVASFTELAREFGQENPDVTLNPISFDGSSTLATQISEGAPADVFASANTANMRKVDASLDAPASVFARNILQIAVQPGNPLHITGLSDLARPGVSAVLCAPEVPCGAAAHTLLQLEKVTLTPASQEQNVKAVLTKVRLGEADAGLVYVTDVAAADGAVEGVDIVGADRAANAYPIATLAAAPNPDAARAFVDFVLSDAGQDILARYGFAPPGGNR